MMTRGQGQAAKELRRAANHGAVIMAWGRFWAMVLLVFFSLGALVTLAGVPMQHIATAIETHQPINVTEAITSATILALVIGMDLAMVIATMMIRALRIRGKTFADWWGYLVLALFVGSVEALTFGVMIVQNEHPVGIVAWLLVGARSVAVPVCAVFLSLVANLPVTPNDVRTKLQIRAGEGLMAYLEMAVQTGMADPSALFSFFGLVNDPRAMEQPGWEVKVQEALARLSPDAVHSELKQRATAAEEKLAETIAQTKERIEAAEERAYEQAIEWTSRAITALASGADLPDWLLEARPELAGITLGKRTTTRGKASPNGGLSAPKSPSDAKRMFLDSLGISPAKAPDNKRGIWVRSSDIPTLSAGAIAKEEATAMARRLGDSARDGLPYIALLDAVMSELMERHKLSEATAKEWASITHSGEDTGEHETVIRLDSRLQARG